MTRQLNVKLVRDLRGGFNNNLLDNPLLSASGELALVSAKSILSTEIVNILQPLTGTDYSPTNICQNIMNNICLDAFVGVNNSDILEQLVYNEFYKIALELSNYKNQDVTRELDAVMNRLKPVINTVILLLSKCSK